MNKYVKIPPPVDRAPFEVWAFNRNMSIVEACKVCGVAYEPVRKALLAPDHRYFRPLSLNYRNKIKEATERAVRLEDWPEKQVAQ